MTSDILTHMQLHEMVSDSTSTGIPIRVLRVVGGWIYYYEDARRDPITGNWEYPLSNGVYVPEIILVENA